MIQFSTSPTFCWFLSSVLRLPRWHLEVLLPLEDQFRILAFCQQVKQNSAVNLAGFLDPVPEDRTVREKKVGRQVR